MRLLLDTHVLLWALIDRKRISESVLARLRDPANLVMFSTASIWEISIKAALGRADFRVPPSRIFREAVEADFQELTVRSSAALRVADLPHHHRDPFDRLLIAQALDEPATLLTADGQLAEYSELVEVI